MVIRRYSLHLNVFVRTVLLIAFLLLAWSSGLYAETIKIGVVNTEQILRESKSALEAHKKIDQEFLPRDAEIKAMAEQAKTMQERLEEQGATMSDTDRREMERELANMSRNYQRAQRQMREDLTVRQNEEYGVILDLIDKTINKVAEKENYDLILQLKDSVYRSQRIDITDKVIEVMDNIDAKQ